MLRCTQKSTRCSSPHDRSGPPVPSPTRTCHTHMHARARTRTRAHAHTNTHSQSRCPLAPAATRCRDCVGSIVSAGKPPPPPRPLVIVQPCTFRILQRDSPPSILKTSRDPTLLPFSYYKGSLPPPFGHGRRNVVAALDRNVPSYLQSVTLPLLIPGFGCLFSLIGLAAMCSHCCTECCCPPEARKHTALERGVRCPHPQRSARGSWAQPPPPCACAHA